MFAAICLTIKRVKSLLFRFFYLFALFNSSHSARSIFGCYSLLYFLLLQKKQHQQIASYSTTFVAQLLFLLLFNTWSLRALAFFPSSSFDLCSFIWSNWEREKKRQAAAECGEIISIAFHKAQYLCDYQFIRVGDYKKNVYKCPMLYVMQFVVVFFGNFSVLSVCIRITSCNIWLLTSLERAAFCTAQMLCVYF